MKTQTVKPQFKFRIEANKIKTLCFPIGPHLPTFFLYYFCILKFLCFFFVFFNVVGFVYVCTIIQSYIINKCFYMLGLLQVAQFE